MLTSGPVILQVLSGSDAILNYRSVMGNTDPTKAEKGTIRADFAKSIDASVEMRSVRAGGVNYRIPVPIKTQRAQFTKSYATGKIPNGFTKREGKLSEREVLASRIVDRAIRPLIDQNLVNEVNIVYKLLAHLKTLRESLQKEFCHSPSDP